MPICIDLLEYGYSSFSLEILEYCDPSKCIEREGDFIKLFSPEYNIIQDPTVPPMSGRTHSDDSKKKCLQLNQGRITLVMVEQGNKILCLVEQGRIILVMVSQNQKDLVDPFKKSKFWI